MQPTLTLRPCEARNLWGPRPTQIGVVFILGARGPTSAEALILRTLLSHSSPSYFETPLLKANLVFRAWRRSEKSTPTAQALAVFWGTTLNGRGLYSASRLITPRRIGWHRPRRAR